MMIKIIMRGPEKLEGRYRYDYVSTRNECGPGCLEFRPGNNATRGQLSKIVYQDIIQP